MNEAFLFNELRKLYPVNEYALIPQVSNATGFQATRHADAVALSLWPSRGLYLSGFEMKCSKSDWRRERENPEKAEAVATYCDFWWIVAASPKHVPVEELPPDWGLYVWNEKKTQLEVEKHAIKRAGPTPPTWSFVAALLRQAQGIVAPGADVEAARAEGHRAGVEEGKNGVGWELEKLRELQKRTAAFERASGIEISHGWKQPDVVGRVVKEVLDGGLEDKRAELVRVAQAILQELKEPELAPADAKPARQRRR